MRTAQFAFLPPFLALVAATVLGGPGASQGTHSKKGVQLVGPFQRATIPGSTSTLAYKFGDLFKLDPNHPLAGEMASQTLSLFGREDLIAPTSSDFKAAPCASLAGSADALTAIEAGAAKTSIVIINESHERSEHRGFIAEVATRLRPLGYDTLAIETLSNSPPGTQERYLPTFQRQPGLPYLVDEDGYYLSEAGFGRLGRVAKRLGYRLLPYEPNEDSESQKTMTREQSIALREEGQARNLAVFVKDHPRSKLLVHVGYSHAAEVPQANGARWLAVRLKEKTGIDPLTISQTTCRGSGQSRRLSALPAGEPAGTFDLVVDHPQAFFERHRPVWRKLMGDQLVSIPRELRPAAGWRVIEARSVGEPITAVPMDRVAIRPGEDVALLLPSGRYNLRYLDARAPAAATAKRVP
ncbi:hypothetical protein [Sphingomonas aerophila]|uniref:ChaN family lipoprotein n=1 Tax=Sphingomonas aerophila TaxID=1344948 RepID=A0A7W9BG69_9SPHN|nr:hypothetical protein [Sphingomonas aerophila]MBB5716261.1 hypothetical protein [Sphingomonas aerophila]